MTRDDIKKLMAAAGAAPGDRMPIGYDAAVDIFEKFAALVAAAERKSCANVCEDHASDMDDDNDCDSADSARVCASLIRGRSQSGGAP